MKYPSGNFFGAETAGFQFGIEVEQFESESDSDSEIFDPDNSEQ